MGFPSAPEWVGRPVAGPLPRCKIGFALASASHDAIRRRHKPMGDEVIETIRWAKADTDLGAMLLAATGKGICRLSFDEDEAELSRRFPGAAIEPGGEALADLLQRAVAAVNAPERPHDLPLDARGTEFQQAVWRELARIPPGESLSYAALAAKAGKPGAARAAGSACGANRIAVLIPCHRARRGDGSPGGFAYGLERKAALLEREGWRSGLDQERSRLLV